MGYGVVFGGGGAKGAYEIGVWKALREMDIQIDAIVGTSVGALNGAIMAQGDFELAVELWNNLKMTTIIEQDIENSESTKHTLTAMVKLIKNTITNGGMDVTPLKQLLNEFIDEEKIRKSKIDFGIVTFSLTDFKPVRLFINDIPDGKLVDYLLASSCFPTFRPQIIDDKRFVDGGIYDNIPISLVLEKCNSIIAIDVSGPGRIRKTDTSTHELINIKNSEYLGGTLSFDGESSKRNIECGYLDTLKAFEKVYGKRYYFSVDSAYKDYFDDNEIEGLFRFFSNEKSNLKGYNLELLTNRIVKLIRQYSEYELNRRNIFMGMLEICAEVVGIERMKTYRIEEIIDEILKEYDNFQNKKPQAASIKYYRQNNNLNHSIIFSDVIDKNIQSSIAKRRIAIGLTQPKLIIANMFLTVILKRKNSN
jgi:NTE family protein